MWWDETLVAHILRWWRGSVWKLFVGEKIWFFKRLIYIFKNFSLEYLKNILWKRFWFQIKFIWSPQSTKSFQQRESNCVRSIGCIAKDLLHSGTQHNKYFELKYKIMMVRCPNKFRFDLLCSLPKKKLKDWIEIEFVLTLIVYAFIDVNWIIRVKLWSLSRIWKIALRVEALKDLSWIKESWIECLQRVFSLTPDIFWRLQHVKQQLKLFKESKNRSLCWKIQAS